MLDQRGQLLRAARGFAGLSRPSSDRALWALRTWLDSWAGIGRIAVGMAHQGYDLQLTRYDERGWRATFYTTGIEHSPTSATGTAWERTPWHATQRAAWEGYDYSSVSYVHHYGSRAMSELSYKDEAASTYDRAFAHVSTHFLPFLLQAARLERGQRVLDAATGTGIAAEAALAVVGAGGHVTAADVSQAMVDRARRRLAGSPNTSVVVEDGQSLSFDDGSFDSVLCSLGLMFFPDPGRGLSEFHRVLRPGGRAAVSVNTTPERSYNGRINVVIARRVPALAEATARTFSLGGEARLRSLFEGAGFRDVETTTEAHRFVLPSFDAYFGPFEQGGGSSGQAYVALPEAERRAVREEVRRSLGDTGGPIGIEVELRFASGRR